MIDVKVEGLEELRDLLQRKLPEQIQTQALQSTLAQAVKPIVQEARTLAPVKTGVLRKAIYSFRSRTSTKQKAVRFISVKSGRKYGKKNAFYWRWIEFGRGAIESKKVLGTPDKGFFGKTVKAVPAQPFLRPAFETRKFEAIEVFRKEMAGQIQKIATRLQSRSLSKIKRKLIG